MSASVQQRWSRVRAALSVMEPFYDWGTINTFRMDARERDWSDESEGEVWFFALQWLGLHFEVKLGRTPPKISPSEVAENKACYAREAAERDSENKVDAA